MVLFVDATPNGALAKEYQKILKESGLRIKTCDSDYKVVVENVQSKATAIGLRRCETIFMLMM